MPTLSRISLRRAAPIGPSSLAFLWIAGLILFQLFYTVIFSSFWPATSIARGAVLALTNVAPLAVLTVIVRVVLKIYVMPLGVLAQGAAHLALAPVFAIVWYAAVVLLQSLVSPGDSGPGWRLMGFHWVALSV